MSPQNPFDRDRFGLLRVGVGYVIHYDYRSREGFRSEFATGSPANLLPLDGVHSVAYVDAVAAGLDSAFAFYRRYLPQVVERLPKPLHVFLANLYWGADGLTWALPDGPEIWLRNRYEEAAGPLVTTKIKATCAHELFHAHQAVCCPESLDGRRPWAWWGEATAVCMEGQVDPSSTEFLAFVFSRLDTPGVSTRNAFRGYGDVLLCEYLLEMIGVVEVLGMWSRAPHPPDPAEAIHSALAKHNVPFGSTCGSDFFGSHFSLALYFPDDPVLGFQTHGALYASKPGRAFVSGIHELGAKPLQFSSQEGLLGLSADYHLVVVGKGRSPVTVHIESDGDAQGAGGDPPVKAVVVQVDGAGVRVANPTELFLAPASTGTPAGADARPTYRGNATIPLDSRTEELLVVIVNSTYGKHRERACYEYRVTVV